MLAAIRQQLASAVGFDDRHGHSVPPRDHEKETQGTPAPGTLDVLVHQLAQRFREALEAVGGRCHVVRGEAEAALAVQGILDLVKPRRVALSNSPLVRRVLEMVRTDAATLEAPPPEAIFRCEIGISGAQWAVAETGTLVLESDEERHRLASLVPPVHIAIVAADRVRQTIAEVLDALSERPLGALSRTVTFVTGPSRTSDIELTLAIGVHGPAELHVVIVGAEQNGP
jgi:L-lactate utilization protein LutC